MKRILFIILLFFCNFTYAVDQINLSMISLSSKNATLQIKYGEDLSAKAEINNQEVLITFSHRIEYQDTTEVSNKGINFIQNIKFGYNTILIIPTKNTKLRMIQGAKRILIDFNQDAQQDDLETKLLRSRLAAYRGQHARSTAILNSIPNHNTDTAVNLTKAGIEYDLGLYNYTRKRAGYLYNKNPYNEDIKNLAKLLLPYYGSYIDIGTRYKMVKNSSDQLISHVQGQYSLGNYYYLGAKVSMNYAKIPSDNITNGAVNPETGALESFDDIRWHYLVSLKKYFGTGNYNQLEGLFNNKVFGVADRFYLWDLLGGTLFYAAYHQPSWDLNEEIVHYGSEDILQVVRYFNFTARFNAELSFKDVYYNLYKYDNLASSYILEALFRYVIGTYNPLAYFFNHDIDLTANYSIYRVFPKYSKTRLSSTTNLPFTPINIADSEIHSVFLTITTTFFNNFILQTNLGYSKDRFGDGGMIYNLNANYEISDTKRVALYYDHSVGGTGISSTSDNIGMNYTWFF